MFVTTGKKTHGLIGTMLAMTMIVGVATPRAQALDAEHRAKAEAALKRAFHYLQATQADDGSWSPQMGPAITAMLAGGMLKSPEITKDHPAVAKALKYVMSRQKSDGGIYDQILGNYNTSIALMLLGPLKDSDPQIAAAVKNAQDYLRGLQWSSQDDPTGTKIGENHPWYGGAGYGNKGRPDLSNTATMIAGLNDSGLVCTDPAYQRALSFISSLQGTPANEKYADQIVPDGGFIYATSEKKEKIGVLQSYAVPDRTDDGPGGKSRLRTYGSMTYAGFMSYLYAKLDRDDPRVKDAFQWIRHNYTLAHNPGMGDIAETPDDERFQGFYYYLHMMSRALAAWGDPVIETADGKSHEWANELIDRLVELQNEDGSWRNQHEDRWSEGDPHLCTAYAVMALQHALQ